MPFLGPQMVDVPGEVEGPAALPDQQVLFPVSGAPTQRAERSPHKDHPGAESLGGTCGACRGPPLIGSDF